MLLMVAFLSILVGTGLTALVKTYWDKFNALPRTNLPALFWNWFSRGIGIPLLVVAVFVFGFIPGVPLLPMKNGIGGAPGKSFSDVWTMYCVLGVKMTGCWAGISFLWMIGAHITQVPRKVNRSLHLPLWSFCALPLATGIGLSLNKPGLAIATAFGLIPLSGETHHGETGGQELSSGIRSRANARGTACLKVGHFLLYGWTERSGAFSLLRTAATPRCRCAKDVQLQPHRADNSGRASRQRARPHHREFLRDTGLDHQRKALGNWKRFVEDGANLPR